MESLDQCKVLTNEQQQQLGLDSPPRLIAEGSADTYGNKGCAFRRTRSEPWVSYLVVPRPQEGIEAWLDGKRRVQVSELTVAGFRAVETRNGAISCNIVIDVAERQSLDIQFRPDSTGFTPDQMCEKARQGAELAMQTLLQR
ncbi:Protein of unknown function (DUF3558) [Streptoalloteichus tenebrarius]|uniref:DUF3558 domain-containing protein n=1 Tax=Streptoalloteichus tenebrarius (strain ATCC 17920 / DSM 40477 / JCM 4838 / CBS 697.72 / NBRC 16177 / NCIMB 11028 / NRRL B-12390 / A12253. 1 / ISP 5477) TaxID=1933 RepID=A0ABT1HVY9_STRSD|nr:Protein of unknown function (DUF3558) [Streptoalloteichus tenebrarius]BFF00671.1 hypothetical protein GCM10020241_23460 [Streptoalloteichus tenebrarius]